MALSGKYEIEVPAAGDPDAGDGLRGMMDGYGSSGNGGCVGLQLLSRWDAH
jgi:hypothetical protein